MELPPGPRHLLTLIPAFAIPSLTVYLVLTLLWGAANYGIPSSPWFTAPVVLLAKPFLFLSNGYYQEWRIKKKASSLGAEIPPSVKEWNLRTIKEMARRLNEGYPCDLLSEFSSQYGYVYRLNILNDAVVATSEPEHIKAILATQFDAFDKGPIFIDQMTSLLGTGVFNADGEMWKFHRSMTRPFFTRERISDFEIYNRNCDITLRTAKHRLDEGYSVDFQDLASRFTMDSATEFLFGQNVDCLSAGIPYPPSEAAMNPQSFYDHPSTAFVKAINHGQVKSLHRLNFGVDWPIVEFWKDEIKPSRRVVDQFLEPLMLQALENRRKDLAANIDAKEDEESLLAHLVKHTQDTTILKDELVNLLVAGRDTTGSLLTFSMYMLTQHPEVEKRLRDEIFDKVGPDEPPTYETMREMRYMRAFLNEVLRLYPPVPTNSRLNNKDVVLPPARWGQKPVYVPANTTTVYSVMVTHRRTDLWGPDAQKFDPDRFLDERLGKYLIPNPFIFSPFNAGPRICLGQQFAYHEATFFLVRLLQKFTGFTLDSSANYPVPAEWASSNDRKAIEKVFPNSHLTMYVKEGLWVRMKEFRI